MLYRRFWKFFFLCLYLALMVLNTSSNTDACPATAEGAVIQGRVIDMNSREPLPHTNVFLAHTTLGVISDTAGYFHIQRIPAGSYQIVANRVGYKTVTKDIFLASSQILKLDMFIEQKPIEAGQVQVVAAVPRQWRSQLARFKRTFIGESNNAKSSELENPEVLRFEIDPASSDLLAYSDSTLRITNSSLGYRLFIILEKFKWGEEIGYYSVFPRFEIMTPKDETEQKQWNKRRRETYLGSFRHFIASLANRSAEMDGYQMFLKDSQHLNSGKGDLVFSDQVVSVMEGMGQKLQFDGYLEVFYRGGAATSYIKLNQNFIMIENNGEIFPPLSVVLYGAWASHRIADTLPLDYNPALVSE